MALEAIVTCQKQAVSRPDLFINGFHFLHGHDAMFDAVIRHHTVIADAIVVTASHRIVKILQ